MKNAFPKIFVLFCVLGIASSVVFPADDITLEVSKKSYKVGENITVNFKVTNPSKEKKNYTIVLDCTPATSEHPGCNQRYIEVAPGETITGTLEDTAEFPVEAQASVKLVDGVTNELIKEENASLKIVSPDDIVCGDGNCDADLGETYDNCPLDCEKKAACGDGTCDPGENSTSCPKDCAATTSTTQPKPAETMNFMDYLPYAAGLLVLVVIIGTAAFIMKKRGAKKIEKQKADFEKWQREREDLK